MTSFYDVCKEGNIEKVNNIVRTRFIAFELNWGLNGACAGGHIDIINLMIKMGADDWNGGLYNACKGGHIKIVNLMIKLGANDWNTGLYNACKGGHIEIVNLMIESSANNWDYGLYGACQGGHIEIINLMIQLGANHLTEGVKITLEKNNTKIAKLLIKKSTYNRSNLYYAYLANNIEVIKLIINKDINYIERNHIFINCCNYKNKNIIIKLIKNGTYINKLKIIFNYDKLNKTIVKFNKNFNNTLRPYIITDLSNLVSKFYL